MGRVKKSLKDRNDGLVDARKERATFAPRMSSAGFEDASNPDGGLFSPPKGYPAIRKKIAKRKFEEIDGFGSNEVEDEEIFVFKPIQSVKRGRPRKSNDPAPSSTLR